ncbi:MAG TPA: hypothetical protein VG650_18590 [Mycobacteriales bacterium]|nr:hypothetical protein [Mycobacteriales bacterium]
MTVRHLFAIITLTTTGLLVDAGAATPAGAAVSFTCVPSDANTCVVTIPLTSDMNEAVTSTMPDNQPWYLNNIDGNGTVRAPYTLTADQYGGNFDGPPGSTQGHVWTETLTTGDNEPSGGDAVLTFRHVNNTTAVPYISVAYSAPSTAVRHQDVTISGKAKPRPAKGHFVLQRKGGGKWKTIETLTYRARTHTWQTTFVWTAARHSTVTLRLEATKAPGLLATPTPAFKIRTS